MMRSHFRTSTSFLLVIIAIAFGSTVAAAQAVVPPKADLSPADVDRIVRSLSSKETEFRRALNEYGFKRHATIQIIGMGGQIAGEYNRVSFFTFDSGGNRYEKIVYFPMPTFGGVTAEDIEDLSGVNPFALEAAKIAQYNFTYAGRERIDELDLYVFDVAPKVKPNSKNSKDRYFMGRIWVDQNDLQIVKSRGKGIPETKDNKFPTVETYREQIDGRYWFPTYSYGDEELVYGNGQVMHIRLRVKYSEFNKGHVEVKITDVDGGNEIQDAEKKVNDVTEMPISGAVLNSKAIELPQPVYPEAAKLRNIAGTVKVEITIAGDGSVMSAEAVDGPKELREAAVEAAKKAKFVPTRLHGQLIKITGYLTYKFG